MAHRELESITLECDLAHAKARLSARFCELAHDGFRFSPLREALSEFMNYSQRFVSGDVRLGLERNRVYVLGRRYSVSSYSVRLSPI